MPDENVSGKETWDLEIRPSADLFDLKLRELWRYRDLLLLFVKRDFTAQYKQTVLGPLWHLIQPVFTTLVFLFVFGKMAKLPSDGEPILFYMSGITIWNYFSTCLTATSNTFIANANIFGKVYFPRLVIPISTVLSNMVKFAIQLLLLLGVMVWFGIQKHHFHFGLSWLFIPLVVLMMAGLGLGLGIIISSLTTKYRDFNVLITFAVQLLMYGTPIILPMSYLVTTKYAVWIAYNPLSSIVEFFRYALFGTAMPDLRWLVYSGVVTVVLLLVGLFTFTKVERTFMDTV